LVFADGLAYQVHLRFPLNPLYAMKEAVLPSVNVFMKALHQVFAGVSSLVAVPWNMEATKKSLFQLRSAALNPNLPPVFFI